MADPPPQMANPQRNPTLERQADPAFAGLRRGESLDKFILRIVRELFESRVPDALETSVLQNKTVRRFYAAIADSNRGDRLAEYVLFWAEQDLKWNFSKDSTYAQCFRTIGADLANDTFDGLVVCGVAASTEHVWNAFPFLYRVWYLISQRNHQAERVLQWVMNALLIKHWAPEEDDVLSIRSGMGLFRETGIVDNLWRARHPSRGPHPVQHLIRGPVPRGLDDRAFTVCFRWLREPPAYSSDIAVYVWQPLEERPQLEWARILVLKQRNDSSRKVILATSSSELLERVAQKQALLHDHDARTAEESVSARLLWFFSGVYKCMVEDLTFLMYTADEHVDKMMMLGKTSPSGWKIKYLLNLQEHLTTVTSQARLAITTAKILVHPPLPLDSGAYNACAMLDQYLDDIEYLAIEIDSLAKRIDEVMKLTKDQVDLSQSFLSTVLAFIVAFYVPLSFATSIFGMNIQDSDILAYWTNTTSFTSPVQSLSQGNGSLAFEYTESNPPGNKAWPIRVFITTAIPLAFGGIFLPLIAGVSFRVILRFVYTHRVWGSVVTALLPLGILLVLDNFATMAEVILVGTFVGWHAYANTATGSWPGVIFWLFAGLILVSELFIPVVFIAPFLVTLTFLLIFFWKPQYCFLSLADFLSKLKARRRLDNE